MIIREKVRIGDQVVTLETGRIAKQAQGSCLVRAGDTIVLVTACGNQDAKPGQSFFPLSVDYQEKTYAAGKIPGGFFKREGRLRDYEILTSRLIDRPCRPLFPEGYLSEVQVVATVMSFDQQNPPDILAMLGASAALHMSPMPWSGPIAGVRVGRVDGEFIANPTFAQMAESDCELLVAASRDAIVMVEGEAEEISEDDLVEALFFAHQSVQDTLDLIERMREAVGAPKWAFAGDNTPVILKERVRHYALHGVREACNIAIKAERSDAFKALRREVVKSLAPEFPGQEELLKAAFEDLRYQTMRSQVLDEGRRLDNRDTRTVRPISIELGVLPRVHGSSLFTRGETQAIVTTTLGTSRDSQRLDTLQGDQHKRFMLHYNFPPYSVGEVKPMRGPGRREIGHGDLAERALLKVLPSQEEFPYAIRIVSEITESNGSSSMASVCGGALALMDAGVPIKAPVAGVAMGLIKEGERYAVLTDILGDEDALGDMDFKVCGTEKGVTAIQMDIKIEGLNREILERALHQAREARLHILDKMQRAIPAPREELSQYAPRITQIRVKPDQVRTIIGPGGKMIRAIVDQTGASIDVADDGTVSVASADSAAVAKALEIIKSLTTDPEIGELYEGVVKRIEPYGAFLEILPGKDGLCHISDIDWSHVTNVEDYMKLGDKVSVRLTNIDREGRIRLSRKDAIPEPGGVSKLNGRAAELRDDGFEKPRAERGRVRDERPRDREERAVEGAREERPNRGRDLGREERGVRARDVDRDERPVRVREPLREERPRDERLRDERPRTRDLDRDERPSLIEREERIRPRDEERVRPRDLDEERAAKGREISRDDKPGRARDFDRDRPRVRDAERPERSAKLLEPEREERTPKLRETGREERPIRPRDLDRESARRDFDERPKAREEREDRSKLRDERPVRVRDLDADERAPVRARDFERDERPPVRVREFERDRPAARDELSDEPRPARGRAEREDRPLRSELSLGKGAEREERAIGRDFEVDRPERAGKARDATGREERAKVRDLDVVERPRRRDDEGRRDRTALDERDDRPRARAVERERPRDELTSARREPERPIGRGRESDRGELSGGRELEGERSARPRPIADRPARIAEGRVPEGRIAEGRAPEARVARVPEGRIAEARAAARATGLESEERAPRAPRDEERAPRAPRDEERAARAPRDEERAPRAPRDEERAARAPRELDREVGRGARRDAPAREIEARGARRDSERALDELPARVEPREPEFERAVARPRREPDDRSPSRARARDDEPARPRAALRDPELDERPRVRRDADDRFERRPVRPDSDRPARTRPPELPARDAKRAPEVDDEATFAERGRESDERVERDRPSRVRSRARNRERVRELERERERD